MNRMSSHVDGPRSRADKYQHKSTKTMNLMMSWDCRPHPILSFLQAQTPIMLRPTKKIVDNQNWQTRGRRQKD